MTTEIDSATAPGVGDRFFGGQRGALGPCGFKVLLAHPVTKRRHRQFEKGVEDLEAYEAAALPDSVCGAEQPRRFAVTSSDDGEYLLGCKEAVDKLEADTQEYVKGLKPPS